MYLIDDHFIIVATSLIKEAQGSIYLSTFKAEICTKPRGKELLAFWDAVAQKKAEGLDVRLLMNWNDQRRALPMTNVHALTFFKKHGIEVRALPRNRCCHAKLIIIDRKYCISGSHNLAVRSCITNFEVSQVSSDFDDVVKMRRHFQMLCHGAKVLT